MTVPFHVHTHVRPEGAPVVSIRPTEDIQPLTSFRSNAAAFMQRIRETGRPIVLTQHGRSAAVLIGAAEYESLIDELETLRDIQASEVEVAEGRTVSNDEARGQILEFVEGRTTG